MAAAERTARIVRVVEHAPDTRSLFFTMADGQGLAFRPGQFVSCLVPANGRDHNRPYSIASEPGNPELEILLDLVPGGLGSRYLFDRRANDTIRLTGPWGTFTLGEIPAAEIVFIAERTGIAPIRPMVLDALARTTRPRLRLLYGTTLGIYRRELEGRPGLLVEVVPPARLVDEAARRFIDADTDRSRHFFVCGVGAPVLTLRDRLRAAGYARRTVQYEKW